MNDYIEEGGWKTDILLKKGVDGWLFISMELYWQSLYSTTLTPCYLLPCFLIIISPFSYWSGVYLYAIFFVLVMGCLPLILPIVFFLCIPSLQYKVPVYFAWWIIMYIMLLCMFSLKRNCYAILFKCYIWTLNMVY